MDRMALDSWDFKDPGANGSISQVNRQKSARNLIVVEIDRASQTGTFLDRSKKATNTASLHQCDCRDFSFAGNSQRKSLRPCMHIYRLAMELGILEAQYEDSAARESRERHEVTLLKEAEDQRLRMLPPDASQWGTWNSKIHQSGLQKNRQYRAYFILDDEPNEVRQEGVGLRIHGYRVSPDHCECMDFTDRRLPCKHIYAAAIRSGFSVSLSASEYRAARRDGLEIIFAFR